MTFSALDAFLARTNADVIFVIIVLAILALDGWLLRRGERKKAELAEEVNDDRSLDP